MYKLTTGGLVVRLGDNALIPNDPANYERNQYEQWLLEGNVPKPENYETKQEAITRLQSTTYRLLDSWAREKHYDSILSLCTYATSNIPKFRAEGELGIAKRDECWATLYALLENIENETTPIPSNEELIAILPRLSWDS